MPKEIREIICILCPMGCKISVEIDNEVINVANAGCKLGRDFSIQEVKAPMRDFFSTVRVKSGKIGVVSIRSTGPVPKSMLMPCAVEVAKVVLSAPVKLGDKILENILSLHVDIIATKNVEKA